jgi:ABC-type branched-subunit amino acid transport system substrate-binding protein
VPLKTGLLPPAGVPVAPVYAAGDSPALQPASTKPKPPNTPHAAIFIRNNIRIALMASP